MLYLLILLVTIPFSHSFFAYIPHAERWELNEKNANYSETANIKILYLVCDYHNGYSSYNATQQEQLLHFIRATKSSVIVEDIKTFENRKLSLDELFGYKGKIRTPLFALASLAHCARCLSTSVEMRKIGSVSEIIESTEGYIKKIENYDDGQILNRVYREYVSRFKLMIAPKSKKLFECINRQNCDLGLVDWSKVYFPDDANEIIRFYEPYYDLMNVSLKQKIKDFIGCYAQEVIDCNILHALADHSKKGLHATVIYAGDAHIDAIKPTLEKLGYSFCKYAHVRLKKDDMASPLVLSEAFQEIEPSYDPNKPLPKTAVDYFLAYKRWEADHPTLKKFVPAYTMAVWYDYYQAWKQEKSVVKKAVPVAIAGTILAVVYVLVSLYLH